MASTSRLTSLFGINDWKRIYQTFSQADFKSYDYETLRKTFIDYLKTYYPETFNDYTESSEYIALLDIIAFMGQGLAFRNDLNTRENFIDTAERRDSVIKLANLVAYNPKRNLTAQGFIKVIRIQTTENINDVNGSNLSGLNILWNDPANANWLDQFNTIINATLINAQRVGKPGNSQNILGVKTDEYSISIPTTTLPIAPFSTVVDTINMDFELVSGSSVNSDYIYEIPPSPSGKFNILYRNDKLGYGSANTGFFFFFKQGSLITYDFNLPEQITNQVVDIGSIEGVNEYDTWLYQVDTTTGQRTLWNQVESVYANTAQNNLVDENRKVFSVVSRSNDQVTYTFGDGVFSEIPVGVFRAYVRSSNALTYTIDPFEMQGITVSISYISRTGSIETLTLGLQLQTPVSNAQSRESLASIKQRAPSRYYTQNRMVNGEDYSNFPYTLYGSIIKSRALNRSSVGITRNLDLLDPTQKYSSSNCFGADGAIYINEFDQYLAVTVNNVNEMITFLTTNLSQALNGYGPKQYYVQTAQRYTQGPVYNGSYWQNSSTNSNTVTGYFYEKFVQNKVPIACGVYSTTNLKYATTGAMLQFSAPPGYYFDNDNRLTRNPAFSTNTKIWVSVINVIGDGYNFGEGSFVNGTGPVILNRFVPSGALLEYIIPAFSNTFSTNIIQQAVGKMSQGLDFSLVFNNSLLSSQDRWSMSVYNDPNYYINFKSNGNNTYTVTYRSLRYYVGSIADTRFLFTKSGRVYDPLTGKVIQDYVKILQSNAQPISSLPLKRDYVLSVVGQDVQPDGYVNDFEVEVASIDVNNGDLILDPDFFYEITNYQYGTYNTSHFVFFRQVQDPANLTRYVIMPSEAVNYLYPDKNSIEVVKYDYPEGQIFYAYNQGVFFKSVLDQNAQTIVFNLVQQSPEVYIKRDGRQSLYYQYRHNSDETTRIDPATTNIIDLYIVPQPYYISYTNWIQDTSGTVPKPLKPTISELNAAYASGIDQYRMISDSVIFNSVVFKPLFGAKADINLRASIKVVRASETTASDSEIRSAVLTAMNNYFNINNWDFGETFYFSEMSAYLHAEVGDFISSAVLVPKDPKVPFGTLYEIKSAPWELFVNGATANDIVVISALTPAQLQITK